MQQILALITAPTQDVVTLDDAKAQLRITDTSQDDLIEALIDASVDLLDPAAGGYLDRALRPQTWELRRNCFQNRFNDDYYGFPLGSYEPITLSFPPLISITSVKYDDIGGVERTLVLNTDFKVLGSGGTGKQSIAPLYNQFWPVARCYPESVRVRYQCGYDGATTDLMPKPIKQAIHLAVRSLYTLGERSLYQSMKNIAGVSETRWIVSDVAAKIVKDATDALLAPYRVW